MSDSVIIGAHSMIQNAHITTESRRVLTTRDASGREIMQQELFEIFLEMLSEKFEEYKVERGET